MPQRPVLDLTFRGVEIRDDTVHFVRRCFRKMEVQLVRRDERVRVDLHRSDGSRVVHAVVSVGGPAVGRGEDPEELLAVSNAFADLQERISSRPELGTARLALARAAASPWDDEHMAS